MEHIYISFNNSITEFNYSLQKIISYFETGNYSEELKFNIQLCIDELVTNIINYGYPDEAEGKIEIYIDITSDKIIIKIFDDAIAYNPLDAPEPDLDAPIESRKIGGLGVFLVKNLTQNQFYERINNKNHFQIEFHL